MYDRLLHIRPTRHTNIVAIAKEMERQIAVGLPAIRHRI